MVVLKEAVEQKDLFKLFIIERDTELGKKQQNTIQANLSVLAAIFECHTLKGVFCVS